MTQTAQVAHATADVKVLHSCVKLMVHGCWLHDELCQAEREPVRLRKPAELQCTSMS